MVTREKYLTLKKERQKAAKQFVDKWQQEEGNEDKQTQDFWNELLSEVYGVAKPTEHMEKEMRVYVGGAQETD